MTTPRQRRFLLGTATWTLLGVAALVTLGRLSLDLLLVVAYAGLTVVTALTAPLYASVGWRRRLRWPLAVGGLIFAALVGVRTLEKFVGTL